MKKKVILSISIIVLSLILILGGNALRNNLANNNSSNSISKKVASANKPKSKQNEQAKAKNTTKVETKSSSDSSNDSKDTKVNQSADKNKETSVSNNQSSNAKQSSSSNDNKSVSSNAVTPSPAPNPPKPTEEPNLTIVDALSNTTILSTYVDVSGKTVGDVTLNTLMSKGIPVETTGSGYSLYISSIAGLAEKEHGKNSGWIYFVNGNSPEVGCGSYKLNQGDKIIWRYSSN